MRKQVFTSQAAAQAAYDADPSSISMTGYPAGEGYEASYTVYFDDDANDSFAQSPREMSLTELFAPLERAHEKQVRAEAIEYEKELFAHGVAAVAQEIAEDRALAGVELQMFVAGFCGVPASVANPRKQGLEPVFRDGRRAKAEKGMAQRCRAAAAALRAKEGYAMDDWLEIAYPCSPVPWRSAFGG